MTKYTLIKSVAKDTGYAVSDCEEVIDLFIEKVKKAIVGGERVIIKDFACFDTKERDARGGRNPKTGKIDTFPPVTVIRCRMSKAMKNAVKGKESD